jgi:molybdopterin-guanine dinucleotide biosynthesis protein A
MPLVTPELVRAVARADPRGAAAVVASSGGEIQPLLGCYQPSALEPLTEAARNPGIRLRTAVEALNPARYEVEDAECLFNVNSPDELLQAAAMLDRRRASRT